MLKKYICILLSIVLIFTMKGCRLNTNFDRDKNSFRKKYGSGIFSGYIYAVKNGKVIIDEAYGMADFNEGLQNTKDTKFNIASLTKEFTAACILQLKKKQLLSLDDTIFKYFKGIPHGNEITIRELLNHTSGLSTDPDNFDLSILDPKKKSSLDKIENMKIELRFKPGKGFCYSNTGYIMLGYIVEIVSGETLDKYMQENIFEPLQMKDTCFRNNNLIASNMAVGYTSKNRKIAENYWYDYSFGPVIGASGLCTTVNDLIKWNIGLNNFSILDKELEKEMYTPNHEGYGFGFYSKKDKNGYWNYYHFGSISGYQSYILRIPQNNSLIIILSNFEDAPVKDLLNDLSIIINKN